MRDKAKELYETGFGSLLKIAEKLNVSHNTIKSWKRRDEEEGIIWLHPKSKKTAPKTSKKHAPKIAPKNDNQKIIEAKKLIVSGETISEVSKKLGVSKSTLMKKSSEEGWIKKRKKFLEDLYEKLIDQVGDTHFKNREESIKFLAWARKKMVSIANESNEENPFNKDVMTAYLTLIRGIKESIETESKLIGITNVEYLLERDLKEQKLELDINKSKEDDNSNEKIISSLDKLEVVLNKIGDIDEN